MARPYSYYYAYQFRTYIKQFLRLFSGIQVQYAVDRDNDLENDFRTVSVHYGDMDKIVSNVLYKNEVFQSAKIPMITGYMTNLELLPENKKARKHTETVGYSNTDTSRDAFSRKMGVPYKMSMDISLYASNTDQMLQMLEQILLMFDPTLHFQKSENVQDWSYMVKAELVGINNEQNYPVGPDDRMIIWTLSFLIDTWLNYPAITRDAVIEEATANMLDDTIDIAGIDIGTVVVP